MVRTFTLTMKREMLALYKCDSCGKLVLQKIALEKKVKYEDRAWTASGREKMHEGMKGKLGKKLDAQYEKLMAGDDPNVFVRAKLKCKCPHCNAKQPWARMRYEGWKWLALLLLIFTMAAAAGMINSDAPFRHRMLLRQLTPLGVGGIALIAIGVGLHCFMMLSKVKANFHTCPPIFARTAAELFEKASKYTAYSGFDGKL